LTLFKVPKAEQKDERAFNACGTLRLWRHEGRKLAL
jgi:hypothetical protein